MKRLILCSIFCLGGWLLGQVQAQSETMLLRSPSASNNLLAFAYAGDIWVADKNGQNARRLTVHQGAEIDPRISPDGKWVAFSAQYDGNRDVYIVSTQGGTPIRLTYHPSADYVRGWQGNNKVLFISTRASFSGRFNRLFSIGVKGGFPEMSPIPEVHQASVSPDGKYTAYIKNPDPTESRGVYRPFKMYRGGNMPRIWIFDNKTYDVTEIPAAKSNNTHPCWANGKVYFLSDRNTNVNVFEYDPQSKQVKQITRLKEFDVKTLTANGQELVLEQAGRIHYYNLANQQLKTLKISLNPDIPNRRPHYVSGARFVTGMDVSPTGVRAVVASRGEIFTVPTKKGSIRNLTNSTGANDHTPAWSPDGSKIAYLSDQSGEYQLALVDQKGTSKPTYVSLPGNTYYYNVAWSPDSKKILFWDKKMALYWVDVNSKKITKVDADQFSSPGNHLSPQWSPDSEWITYAKMLDNQLRGVFVYNLKSSKKTQLTDGMSEADHPTFSRDGKYLFFTASTNYALNIGWLDMTNYERPIRRSIYAIVLSKNGKSPLFLESDEEKVKSSGGGKDKKAAGAKKGSKNKGVTIDFDNISQRIIALPMPPRNYFNLSGLAKGKLFYQQSVAGQGTSLQMYNMKSRKASTFMPGVFQYIISADGKKVLYAGRGNSYGITSTARKAKPGAGRLNMRSMRVYVDPAAEWKQMFNEVWRIERDYFYVKNMHGVDWKASKKRYEPFLNHVGHREDLNYLFSEMMGELVVGHNYVGAGAYPNVTRVNVGLLGADYEVSNGYYRFKKIFSGLNWNPNFRAPLTEPGVNVKQGDYLVAVNGVPLRANQNVYDLFQNTANTQITITVNSQPSANGGKTFTVKPIFNEGGLRNMDWVEGNRKKVDKMSNGQVAYVYMPNTGGGGYTFFNRYYFSQLNKKAVVIDERFNGGGSAADYVIDLLDRDLMNYWGTRDGKVQTTPGAAIFGPKAMIINEYAASGGDLMPFLFREKKIGKLIGKRTLGILIGIYGYPRLMDGGLVTAPRLGIFDKNGKWIIENEGVSPDIEVEMTPKEVIAGKDPQLEKAVQVVMEEMKKNPIKMLPKPKGPNRAKK